jgi:hypothetical protein
MIKTGRLPRRRVVTRRAGVAELIARMIRAIRAVEIGLVTGKTFLRRARILAVRMTQIARRRRVRSG